ncbi:hypothetical protein CFBP6109_02450 [Pseudomonas syringae pv. cerasicola]|nr:hypothetical protein CFBP6109_02438 [Pseudomonas syringae pv. cerasicola]SOS17511.1 hypothetical protein CFBP6109_02450 [Pseudomonas syringae pv. cerasicola]
MNRKQKLSQKQILDLRNKQVHHVHHKQHQQMNNHLYHMKSK